MLGSCRLNNKSMRNVRRTETYQAIAIDLALLGVITKEECEMLLDGGIPSGIVLPDGSSKITSEKALPPKPEFIKTETGDTETDRSHGPVDTDSTMNGDDVNFTQAPVDDVQYEIVSDGATTEPVDSVDLEPGNEPDEPQETVDDEGRTESDN